MTQWRRGFGSFGSGSGSSSGDLFFAVFVAVVLIAIALALFTVLVKNATGRGKLKDRRDLEELAKGYWGDLDLAAAHVRSVAPFATGLLSTGLALGAGAILGTGFDGGLWKLWAVSIVVIVLWWLLERELGFPGFLVPPAVRGTRGMLAARLEARRRRRRGEVDDRTGSRGA